MDIISRSDQETFALGQKIANLVANNREVSLVCLYGELGSGKTTFVQGMAKSLGIKQLVPSPTFIIVRQYKIKVNRFTSFFHIDLYRLENKQEITNLGLSDIFSDSHNIIVVEWAEKLGTLKPKQRIDIKFDFVNENTRRINISGISGIIGSK